MVIVVDLLKYTAQFQTRKAVGIVAKIVTSQLLQSLDALCYKCHVFFSTSKGSEVLQRIQEKGRRGTYNSERDIVD
jgi:hypothetical protein